MTVINTPGAADYGRNPDGSIAARNEWWAQQNRNDADQGIVQGAEGYANQQAGLNRGAQANESTRYSDQEASGAGGHQQGAIGIARSLATGSQPSAAAYQLQAGLNQSLQQQSAIARGARGSAAIATAGANNAANNAALQQNAYTQGGILRAHDMAIGRGLYGSMLGEQQQQDQARLGQANDMSQFNADLNDKYSLGMGQAAVGLGGVSNAQRGQDFNYYQGGMGVVDAQSEADQQHQRWLYDARKQAAAANNEDR